MRHLTLFVLVLMLLVSGCYKTGIEVNYNEYEKTTHISYNQLNLERMEYYYGSLSLAPYYFSNAEYEAYYLRLAYSASDWIGLSSGELEIQCYDSTKQYELYNAKSDVWSTGAGVTCYESAWADLSLTELSNLATSPNTRLKLDGHSGIGYYEFTEQNREQLQEFLAYVKEFRADK
ncbi:hypothetical protein K8R78_00850 [bacterium]|nr:hypothetical protein [bacterium]